jgi:hypothetical protein
MSRVNQWHTELGSHPSELVMMGSVMVPFASLQCALRHDIVWIHLPVRQAYRPRTTVPSAHVFRLVWTASRMKYPMNETIQASV